MDKVEMGGGSVCFGGKVEKIPAAALGFRVVKERWYHVVLDRLTKTRHVVKIGTITAEFDILAKANGSIFIGREQSWTQKG